MGTVRFKNGNINVRFDRGDLEDIRAGHVSALEVMTWALDEVDTTLIGEEFCLGNYSMGVLFYSCYSDRVYVFDLSDLETLAEGKTVKLYAKVPDEYDRELIAAEGW